MKVEEAFEALMARAMPIVTGTENITGVEYAGRPISTAARALGLAAAQRVIDYDTDHEVNYADGEGGRKLYCCSYHLLEWELEELGR